MPPIELIDLHRGSAHFPIGLLVSSVFFDTVALATRRQSLRDTALWTLLLGVAAAAVSVILGLVANPYRNDTGEIAEKVVLHQWVGIGGLVLFALLALWRVRRRNDMKGLVFYPYALVSLVGAAVILYTGFLGGHLLD